MTKHYATESEYPQLRSVRRAKQRRLNDQDRLIKRQMLEEDRAKSAKKRKASRQVKMDRVIGYIQAIADECKLNGEDEFDFDSLVSFLAKRGVMSWPRTRLSEPTHEEHIFIAEALDQAQARGLISLPKQPNGKRKFINNFPTLPRYDEFSVDELFVFGKRHRQEFHAA